jgi:propanol-preferring alcohol dehydrogenase
MTAAIVGLGGVGIHAAQIGRASGARIVGFDLHEPTLASARDLDLDLDARRADDEDAIRELIGETDGEGVGYAPTSSLTVPAPRFVLDEIDYMGSRYPHRYDLARAVSLVERGLVSMVVGLVRPLEEVDDVFQALEAGSVVGRAVLDVAGITALVPGNGGASDIVAGP